MTIPGGKRALITGSSSGIGTGVALAFADAGARVAINYPDDARHIHGQRLSPNGCDVYL